jgi:alkaline phosphatase
MVECDLHTSNPRRGLDRAVAFDKLIAKVAGEASKNTLVLFTADHSYDFRLRTGRKSGGPTMPESNKVVPGAPRTDVSVGNTHTGEEVMVAAQGPGSERVKGVMANTDLFGIMLAAWGWKR